jgi:hypothetical protein
MPGKQNGGDSEADWPGARSRWASITCGGRFVQPQTAICINGSPFVMKLIGGAA